MNTGTTFIIDDFVLLRHVTCLGISLTENFQVQKMRKEIAGSRQMFDMFGFLNILDTCEHLSTGVNIMISNAKTDMTRSQMS